MRKQVLFIVIMLVAAGNLFSQTQLWGTTVGVSNTSLGTVFKMNLDGTSYTTVISFPLANGYQPRYSLVKAPNNKIYGVGIGYNAAGGGGCVYAINPVNSSKTFYPCALATGMRPVSDLLLANGIFYGVTDSGGVNNEGTIFSFDPSTNKFANLFDVPVGIIFNPGTSLLFGDNGDLYGCTIKGGGSANGYIFKFNLATKAFTPLYDLPARAFGKMTKANGFFYGQLEYGNGGPASEKVFTFDPSNNVFTTIVDDIIYSRSFCVDILGRLYGYSDAGMFASGSIVSIAPITNDYTNVFDFELSERAASGVSPIGGLAVSGRTLFGATYSGGINDRGLLFRYSTITNGFVKLHDFISADLSGTQGRVTGELTIIACYAAPPVPGAITISGGSAKVCQGDVRTYTITALPAATSYEWTAPAGATITSGQGTTILTLTYTAGFIANGTLTVKAKNGCGISTAKTLTITRNIPATPGTITGLAKVCPGDVKIYSVPFVAGMNYTWTAPGNSVVSGLQGGHATNITYAANFISGTLSVNASNGCGTSAARTLAISLNALTQPSAIAVTGGTAAVCPGDVRTYTVTDVSGMSYDWILPVGATMPGGSGRHSHSIVVTFGAGFTATGNLSVTASNSCGTSAARTLVINRNNPPTPGTITGLASVCAGNLVNYSVPAITGITSFTWIVAADASVQTGQGTRTVSVLWGSKDSLISVFTSNACGQSVSRTKAIDVTLCRPVAGESISRQSILNEKFFAQAYPNPTNGKATVEFNSPVDDDYFMRVLDITGREVMVQKGKANRGVNIRELDLSGYAKGIYILSVKAGEKKQLIRLMVRE